MVGVSVKNSGQFIKGQTPWNYGKGKKWYCKTCGEEFKKSNGSRRVYCSHKCKLSGYWGKINKTLNVGRMASKELRKLRSKMAKERQAYKALFRPDVRKKALKKSIETRSSDDWVDPKMGSKRSDIAGENNPNWKGGITSKDRKQRVRFRSVIQKKIFKRDNYTCQLCKKRGGFLQVDHIESWSENPELRFDMDNCRTLCKECHYLETYGRPIANKDIPWGHNLISRKEG